MASTDGTFDSIHTTLSMQSLDLDEMEKCSARITQLMASEASYRKTTQALVGMNVSIIFFVGLFVAYRYFKKAKPRPDRTITSGSDGYDILHPVDDARLKDDGLHDVGPISEETSTFHRAMTAHFPLHVFHLPLWRPRLFSKSWKWGSKGQSKEGAAEEGKSSLPPNHTICPHWDRFLEQGRDAFGVVPALIKVPDRRNIGSAEARPPFSQGGKPKKSTPLVTDKSLGNRDRRSPDRTPPISNSRQTTARTATATTSSRAHRHRGRRKPFPVTPASARIGSRMVPPSSFPAFDTQRPRDRISRSTTASSDMGSIPSLPSYQHYSDNADGSTSPTPSSPSAYGHGFLRESAPQVPPLPRAVSVGAPKPPHPEGRSRSNNPSVEGHESSPAASARASTMSSARSDASSSPPLPSFHQAVKLRGSVAPIPSSPPLLDGYDWLRASRTFSLLGIMDLVAGRPPGVEEGRTTPAVNLPMIIGRRPTVPLPLCSPTTSDARTSLPHVSPN